MNLVEYAAQNHIMLSKEKNKVAIIAGGGDLPNRITYYLEQEQIPYIVLAIADNCAQDFLAKHRHFNILPGQVKNTLAILAAEKVTDIVFAGHIKRPGILNLKTDSEGLTLLAKIAKAKIRGDDQVLSIITDFLESKGYRIIAPNDIMPSLLAPIGILSKATPSEMDLDDITLGKKILNNLSKYDIGQAIIVENGLVLGIEGPEGTSNLLSRSSTLKREATKCGVLVKIKKQKQDVRIDLPTIGPKTIEQIFEAGLNGVAIQAKNCIILDIEKTIELANKKGIFIIGIK